MFIFIRSAHLPALRSLKTSAEANKKTVNVNLCLFYYSKVCKDSYQRPGSEVKRHAA